MKRTTRTFVVERRNGRKPRSWFDDMLDPSAETPAVASAVSAVFRDMSDDGTVVTPPKGIGSTAPSARVLPDLRETAPVVDAPVDPQAPKVRRMPVKFSTVEVARRPRGRPRKQVAPVATGSEAPGPAKLVAEKPPGPGACASMKSAVAIAAMGTDLAALEVTGADNAVVAQVKQRIIGRARARAVDDLPAGQRWKKRLHPASW